MLKLYLAYILVHCVQHRFDFFKIISQLSPKTDLRFYDFYDTISSLYLKLIHVPGYVPEAGNFLGL